MLGICNSWICVLAVRGMRQQGARSRHQQSNKRMSWKATDVRKGCSCDRTFGTSADVLQDAKVVIGQHTEECRARIEQEMVDKGDAIKLETSGNQKENVQDLDVRDVGLKKRKVGERDINPGGASS